MKIIGLTGSIATGKSTVAQMLLPLLAFLRQHGLKYCEGEV